MQRLPHQAGKVGHVWKHMKADENRNQMIADLAKQAYDADRSLVIFSETMDILHSVRECLRGMVSDDNIGWYVGLQFYKGPKEKRRQERDRGALAPVTLATYAMASEATNCPWWDTAIYATPRSDVVQITGRIRREYEGKKFPVVFDIVDDDSHVFAAYRNKRLQWYMSLGCEVIQGN